MQMLPGASLLDHIRLCAHPSLIRYLTEHRPYNFSRHNICLFWRWFGLVLNNVCLCLLVRHSRTWRNRNGLWSHREFAARPDLGAAPHRRKVCRELLFCFAEKFICSVSAYFLCTLYLSLQALLAAVNLHSRVFVCANLDRAAALATYTSENVIS
jgi:hypothetical protein